MKVVIIGKGEMLSNLIEGAIDANCEIAGVLRYERSKYNPLILKLIDFFNPSPELTIIKQNKIRDLNFNSANSEEFRKELIKLNVDVLLVGTWGEKIKKITIDTPAIASVNVHPSLLPKYRGPNPYLQNILNCETKSGLTFHLIDEKFDNGPILLQKPIQIFPNETSKELKARTVFQARLMCAEILKKLEFGMIIPIKQKQSESTYYPNITDNDKMLDFNKESAQKIHARIRALHPWLPTYITYKNEFLIPNPYRIKILNRQTTENILKKNKIQNPQVGEIIDKNLEKLSITIMCLNGESLLAENIKIYGLFKSPKNFIKNLKIC